MRELTEEEKVFLVDYCMKPENTRLALEIGQVYPKLREEIVSLFLKELDKSVKKGLDKRNCQWQTCIPKTNPEEGEEPSIYVMTMKERGIKIHLARYKWQALFVGTRVSQECWPKDDLSDFLTCGDWRLNTNNKHWHWWFNPIEKHRFIGSVEALSTLNDGQKIGYFTVELVRFAEAISKALEARK